MSNADLAAEAALAREFAAKLEERSEAADNAGDHDRAQRLHNRARAHRADARDLEAKLAAQGA